MAGGGAAPLTACQAGCEAVHHPDGSSHAGPLAQGRTCYSLRLVVACNLSHGPPRLLPCSTIGWTDPSMLLHVRPGGRLRKWVQTVDKCVDALQGACVCKGGGALVKLDQECGCR